MGLANYHIPVLRFRGAVACLGAFVLLLNSPIDINTVVGVLKISRTCDCVEVLGCMQPYISAANNACWALGLLATALPSDAVAPLVPSSAERMLHVLKAAGGSVQRRLRENAAISVGRLATVQPSALAVHLSHFLGDWCVTLATITVCLPVQNVYHIFLLCLCVSSVFQRAQQHS